MSDKLVKWSGWGVAAAALIYAAGVESGRSDDYADAEGSGLVESTTTTTGTELGGSEPVQVEQAAQRSALLDSTAQAGSTGIRVGETDQPPTPSSLPPPVYLAAPAYPISVPERPPELSGEAPRLARAETPSQLSASGGDDLSRTAPESPSAPATAYVAEPISQAYVAPPPMPLAPAVRGCAENGSCYGDISAATGAPKTVAVRGYYRKDGTYVRGHYRSK